MKTKELAILAVLLAPAFTFQIEAAEAAVVVARPVVIARPVVTARPAVRAPAPVRTTPAATPHIVVVPHVATPAASCSEKERKERKC